MSAYIDLSCCGLVGRSEVCNKVTADVGTVSGMLWHVGMNIEYYPTHLCRINDANEPISDAMARVSKYSTKDGVEDLLLHVTALGRFGNTAFLTAMYGSGELSQAFCRSGAVYGSTYMLRRPPLTDEPLSVGILVVITPTPISFKIVK